MMAHSLPNHSVTDEMAARSFSVTSHNWYFVLMTAAAAAENPVCCHKRK